MGSRLFVNGDVSMNSRLFVSGDVSMGSRLFVSNDVSMNGNLYTLGRTIHQGDVSMNSRLFVNGDVSMNSRLFVAGDVSMGSRLFVNGDVSMNSRLFVAGDVSMGARLFVNGDVSMNSRLFLNGDMSMNSRLFVSGDVSMGSRLFVNGDVSMNSRLFVTGDVSMGARLFVNGDVSFNSRLFLNGDMSMNSRLFVSGDVSMGSRLFVNGDVSMNSRLFVAGDVSMGARLFVNGDVSMNSRLFLNGDMSMNSRLFVSGDVSMGSRLFVNGDVSMNSRLFVTGDVSMNSRLFVSNDVSMNGNLYTLGRTIHQGDVSINSRLFVGNDLLIYGRLSVQEYTNTNIMYTNVTTSNYTLIIVEDISLNGRLNVYYDASLSSRLFVGSTQTSTAYTNGALTVAGGIGVGGNIYVNGNLYSNSYHTVGTNTVTAGNILSINGNTYNSGNVYVAGTNNYISGNLGIGTTSPSYPLDVTGITRINQSTINSVSLLSYNSTNAVNTMFFVPYLGAGGFNSITAANDTGIFWGNATGSATGGLVIAPWATGPSGIRMDKNGNVGIGVSAPGCALDVNGTIRIASGSSFTSTGDIRFTTPSSNIIFINNDKTSGDIRINYAGALLNTSSAIRCYGSDGTATTKEIFTVLNSGNVGINNTAPTNKFQVSGGNYYTSLIATSVGSGTYGYGAVQQIYSNGQAVGSTAGCYTPLLQLTSLNGNVSYLNFYTYRNANGADWTTSSTRIQQCIDTSPQGYIEFNSNTNNSGVGVYGSSGLGIVVSQLGSVNFNATSVTHSISSTTATSSSSTGALVVTGGVGIGGGLIVAGDVRTSSKLYIGVNDPGGGYGDSAWLEYVAISGEQTTLRINTMNDTNDDINLNPSGNVGIKKDTPTYTLDVNGNVNATSYNATSDIRIKTNVININGTYAVDVLRKLEPKKYSYIDNDKEDEYTWGFIGQDLENCFDYSTTKSKEYIPNIYDYADLSNNKIIKLQSKSTTEFLLNSLTDTSLCKVRLLTSNKKNEIIRTIDKIIDDTTFSIVEPITQTDLSGNSLFVYGQMVEDFRSVNYTSVFTVTTAAVKEIDKELQKALSTIEDQNKTIQNLTDDVNELKAMVKLLMNK
jgi:predicted acyltransferase (DUF342 family)